MHVKVISEYSIQEMSESDSGYRLNIIRKWHIVYINI